MQMALVARCRSVQISCAHNRLCNICRIAWPNAIAPILWGLDMRFWSFTGVVQARILMSPIQESVFPPRGIQKARPPTGPSSRLRIGRRLRDLRSCLTSAPLTFEAIDCLLTENLVAFTECPAHRY
jgi:hypothetical protein